jgi:DNA-binding CsgD family transcriptional regulator
VPGWFPEGLTFLGGGPKAGKSWLSQAVGLAVASGLPVLGSLEAQQPRPVMYFALEDSDRRIKARSAELGWPELPELFWYTTKAAPDQVLDDMDEFLAHYRGQRPVAIIDTWGKIMSPARKGETTYDRDYRMGSDVKQCVDDYPGSSLIINHHTRKEGATDFIDTLSGTFGVAGSADTIAILARKRGELSGQLHVTGRDVEEDSYQLAGFPRWELDGGSLPEAASRAHAAQARASLSDRSTQVLDLVAARGEILTAEVALALGISSDTASTYLGRLAGSGKIEKAGRGSGVRWVLGVSGTQAHPV